jgi:hypothetical protein
MRLSALVAIGEERNEPRNEQSHRHRPKALAYKPFDRLAWWVSKEGGDDQDPEALLPNDPPR